MNRKYEFLGMPFGLRKAPFSFQSTMVEIIDGIECVKIYLDDLLIHSKSHQVHIEDLKTVLNRLKSRNMTINKSKSEFFKQKVRFLGQIVSGEGVRADVEDLGKIVSIKKPINRKKLQGIFKTIQC